MLEFPERLDDVSLQQQLTVLGIKTQPLSRYLFNAEPRSGLVLGIGHNTVAQLTNALAALIALCRNALQG